MQGSGTNAPLDVLGRLLMVILFLWSGLGKVMMPAGTIGYIAMHHLPLPQLAYIIAVVVEILFSLLVLIGFQFRIAAFLMAIYTIAAGFGFHLNLSTMGFTDLGQEINFWKNISIAGGLLFMAAHGAGAWSVDARRAKV